MKEDKKNKEEEQEEVLEASVGDSDKKAQEYLDGWKRAQADFANYKKDELKRVMSLASYQTEGIIGDIIEIADTFDSAFKVMSDNQTPEQKSWLQGIQYVRKQIDDVLKKNGIEKISVTGAFDPRIHEALELADGGESQEIQEVRAGYMIGDRVIRPARISFKKK